MVKMSLNLRYRSNPILVAVSLVFILMASGLAFFWVLIRNIYEQWVGESMGSLHGGISINEWYTYYAGIIWSGITLLAGLMIIKKSLNLHSRPNPFQVAVSLTLILMAGGLVIIIWIWVGIYGHFGELLWFSSMTWSVMTFLGGLIILVPREPPSEPMKALRRLKCPHCAAVYAYDEQEGIEPGFVRCQNCDREFGPTGDKQASQAISIR